MKFTLSWLKDHLETEASLETISAALTLIGLEVATVVDPGAELDGFIVGHVLEAEKHPNADRLRLCRVSTGQGEVQIVCGAPNARADLKVALALPGCVIPATGETLKTGKIRGCESQGMMCSVRELKQGEDHDGIIELPAETPVGTPLARVFDLETTIDVEVTPNRPDCLGVRGIARDLAAYGLGRLKEDPTTAPVAGVFKSPVGVRHDASPEALKACPAFYGRMIRGVRNGESPPWLKKRLTAVGLRPISALVDITNYVMIGWGRPLHVFDAAALDGDLVVRMARPGEILSALNEKNYRLDETMAVIADRKGVQSLGGIIGGQATEATEKTVDVFVEAACFDPRSIASTGRKLAVVSDARHRFERGVDPASAAWGMEAATRLILELCGGTPSEVVVSGAIPPAPAALSFRPARTGRIVGVAIPGEEQKTILERLGCRVGGSGDCLEVAPPSWRFDIDSEIDLVEEVIRINGLDKIPEANLSPAPASGGPFLTPRQRQWRSVIRALAAQGLFEAVTWSFLPRAQARLFGGGGETLVLSNPISADLDCLRPSALPNLIAAAARNAVRGMPDAALFEVGPIFTGGNPGQQERVASGVRTGSRTKRHWDCRRRPVDAFDAKADALAALKAAGIAIESLKVVAEAPVWLHPGRSGTLRLGTKTAACFGALHPAVLQAFDLKGSAVGFEVFLDALPLPKEKGGKAKSPLKASPFQPLERDFAFVVDRAVQAERLVLAAKSADGALVVDVAVFDLYEGDPLPAGKKSIALCATLQPTEKTMTDAEIEAVSARIIAAIEQATGAVLRR